MRVIELSSFYLLVASLLTAEVNLGPAGAVAIGLDSSVRHTSNVFLNSSEQSDIIYTLLPTVNYRSNQGAIELDAFMGIAMVHYSDFSSYNAENLKFGFNATYPREKNNENISLAFSGSYVESNEASKALLDIVNVDTLNLSSFATFLDRRRLVNKALSNILQNRIEGRH